MPGMPTHSLIPRLGPEAGHSEEAATGLGGSFRKGRHGWVAGSGSRPYPQGQQCDA